MERYGELVRDLLIDQWTWSRDRSHRRLIDDTNAIESLRMAEAANKFAKGGKF
ncbi:MAG: hypothetical protein ABIV51_03065 [Saprospiraceae bacterium]